jgi:predicted amidophosphoribosyltransferase
MLDNQTGIYYLENYNPYWITDEYGERIVNPNASTNVLNFKRNDPKSRKYFFDLIKDELINFRDNANVYITHVPSHEANKHSESLGDLCEMLADYNNITYLPNCLLRTNPISKLAPGGDRSMITHFNSITIPNGDIIKGKTVILIDDVTTTGNSLLACKQLLSNAGIATFALLSLTKTCH